MKKVNEHYVAIQAELNNALLENGYKFMVRGDFKVLDTTDPWSGMPDIDEKTYFFKDEKEASEFAKTQLWPFSGEPLTPYKVEKRETWAEYEERKAKEKADRKAKREANEKRKAEEAGMTVKEYRRLKAVKSNITRVKNEIAELEKTLKKKKAYLKKCEEEKNKYE